MSISFLHLSGEEVLDALIAKTNLLEGKLFWKSYLGGCSIIKFINHEELLVFLSLTITMKLVIKGNMIGFCNTEDWSQKPISFIFFSSFNLGTSYPTDTPAYVPFPRK